MLAQSILTILLHLAVTLHAYESPAQVLKSAATFGLLASSAITNTGTTTVHGDVGLSPGSSISGFATVTVIGSTHVDDTQAVQAQTDATAAGVYLAGLGPPTLLASGTLDGLTLVAGVYSATTTLTLGATLPGVLTLNGANDPQSTWVFQVGSALTTGASGISTIQLTNGALACNVYWNVGTSATINVDHQIASIFIGNIVAQQSITIDSGTILGSMLALNAAVTISSGSTISAQPTCPTARPSSSPTNRPTSKTPTTKHPTSKTPTTLSPTTTSRPAAGATPQPSTRSPATTTTPTLVPSTSPTQCPQGLAPASLCGSPNVTANVPASSCLPQVIVNTSALCFLALALHKD